MSEDPRIEELEMILSVSKADTRIANAEDILRLIDSVDPIRNWQPIKTLPKSYLSADKSDPDCSKHEYYENPKICLFFDENAIREDEKFFMTPVVKNSDGFVESCGAYPFDGAYFPTHWMPLPEPPAEEI